MVNAYADVDLKRKRSMEIAQIIDESLYEYYSERVNLCPIGKKESRVWTEYLIRLGHYTISNAIIHNPIMHYNLIVK